MGRIAVPAFAPAVVAPRHEILRMADVLDAALASAVGGRAQVSVTDAYVRHVGWMYAASFRLYDAADVVRLHLVGDGRASCEALDALLAKFASRPRWPAAVRAGCGWGSVPSARTAEELELKLAAWGGFAA